MNLETTRIVSCVAADISLSCTDNAQYVHSADAMQAGSGRWSFATSIRLAKAADCGSDHSDTSGACQADLADPSTN
jgi:hypothetical protein